MHILLADDHSLFRDALVAYIERAAADMSVATARDIHEAMEAVSAPPVPDLVLLDLRMPGMEGLEGLKRLIGRAPDVPVALISGLAEKEDIEAALKLGARGYFPKTMSGKALVAGIRDIMAGERFVALDHNTGDVMASYYSDASRVRDAVIAELSPREREVLGFLMRGESNKEIARALGLKVVTVKLHVRGVCRKLGARNRTQAAMIGREKGL